ncbi:unnamed protein product [Hyaloperonospora brassicae]|uniref:Uncharacterized protein n=1 Tax=Hyaloperonospora brassicae TaxID=162125 RepID=A0AAV0TMT0_HYABA|nr:unnamed protein product [Hyaloperonospora brassicae]
MSSVHPHSREFLQNAETQTLVILLEQATMPSEKEKFGITKHHVNVGTIGSGAPHKANTSQAKTSDFSETGGANSAAEMDNGKAPKECASDLAAAKKTPSE